jgi:uncharacterized protein affecting Mg2+/Co2+ transport
LTRRHWDIIEGDDKHVVDGEGVIGYFPTIDSEMEEPFVYESCCPTKCRGTLMKGWFEFKYLIGPKKDQTFRAKIDPFILEIEEGTSLTDDPNAGKWLD